MRLQSSFLYWNSGPHREPVKSLLQVQNIRYGAGVPYLSGRGQRRVTTAVAERHGARWKCLVANTRMQPTATARTKWLRITRWRDGWGWRRQARGCRSRQECSIARAPSPPLPSGRTARRARQCWGR